MGTQARVTSLEALDAFRANLILFMHKARRSLDDVNDEVRRTRLWLQHDQRMHWEGECRKRAKVLDQMEQELLSLRITGGKETSLMVRQAAVQKAKRALEEAKEKLHRVKEWTKNYDSLADPAVKRLDILGQFLGQDMPKAIAYLVNLQRALSAYAETAAAAGTPAAVANLAAPTLEEPAPEKTE